MEELLKLHAQKQSPIPGLEKLVADTVRSLTGHTTELCLTSRNRLLQN